MNIATSCIPPLRVGQFASPVTAEGLDLIGATKLGGLINIGSRVFRLVRAAADITTPQRLTLVTAVDAGNAPTYSVNTTTTANSSLAVGVVPTEYGTTTIPSGAYFWVQVSGPAQVIAGAAVAQFALVGTSTTAGRVDDLSITAGVGAIGVALESAAANGDVVDVILKGLL